MSELWLENEEKNSLQPATAHRMTETDLQRLVARDPRIARLGAVTNLAVLGEDLVLGNIAPDILAVEPSGRPVIIEIRIAREGRSNLWTVARALWLASGLARSSVEQIDAELTRQARSGTGSHPGKSVEEICSAAFRNTGTKDNYTQRVAGELSPPGGTNDRTEPYAKRLARRLARGEARIVLVLNEATDEIEQVAGYLAQIGHPTLMVDVVIVKAYQIGNQTLIETRRVAGTELLERTPDPVTSLPDSQVSPGNEAFLAQLEHLPSSFAKRTGRVAQWMTEQAAGNDKLTIASTTTPESNEASLALRIKTRSEPLIELASYAKTPRVHVRRNVLEDCAPKALRAIEEWIAPHRVDAVTRLPDTDEVMALLSEAIAEACADPGPIAQ